MTDCDRIPDLRPVTPLGIATREIARLRTELVDGTAQQNDMLATLDRIAALVSGLEGYVEQATSPQSPALAALAERTASEPWAQRFAEGASDVALEAEMLSGHVEGQFLKMLVAATGAKRVLEIGLFTGYSALAMAEALPTGGTLTALELDPFVARFAQQSFTGEAGARITIEVGPAIDSLAALAGSKPFDFIFIDADKGGYCDYLDALLDGDLLTANALIAVDNTLLQGEVYGVDTPGKNARAIAAFNRKVANDARLTQVLVPLRDGVTLIRRA